MLPYLKESVDEGENSVVDALEEANNSTLMQITSTHLLCISFNVQTIHLLSLMV